MEIKFNISETIIGDLFCTALEGGSNYWYMLGDVDETHFIKDGSLTFTDNLTRSFMIDKNYKINVYDRETCDDDEENADLVGSVTYDSIVNAFSVMARDYKECLARIMSEEYDADDADVWLQIATMGEVVFG